MALRAWRQEMVDKLSEPLLRALLLEIRRCDQPRPFSEWFSPSPSFLSRLAPPICSIILSLVALLPPETETGSLPISAWSETWSSLSVSWVAIFRR